MPAEPKHAQSSGHSLTRRNFFRMAVGSLVALPSVAGGYLVEVPTALAAEEYRKEADGGPVENPTTEIVIVAGYELGVNVVDTAAGDNEPVVGALVTLTSRYNGKEVHDTTNNKGRVQFDIRDLAEDLEGVGADNLSVYAFNGTITVECEGYRKFEMALTRIVGGGGVTAYTRNLSEGASDPYPRTVAFNGWDVLYTSDNEFITSPKNDIDQTLSIDFRQMPAGAATVMLKERGTGATVMSTTSNVGSDGVLKASFVGKHLQTGSEGALREDQMYDIEVVQGNQHTQCPVQLSVTSAVSDEDSKSDTYQTRPIDTSLTSTTLAQIKWPSGIPLIGGADFRGFSPDFYCNAYYNPLGYFQITFKTPSMGYMRDTGHAAEDDGQGWQTFPCKFPQEWWASGMKQMREGASRARQGFANGGSTGLGAATRGAIKPIDTFASIKVAVNLQLVAIAKWNSETKIFQGMGAGQLFFSVITSISANFWAGPIPVLVTFDFNFTSVISLSAGFYTAPDPNAKVKELALDFDKWKWDYSNTGLTMTYNLIPSLSAGVGVRGIGSVSVRGKFQLTISLGLTARGDLDPDAYELPHAIGGYAAEIAIVISMFFFTTSFPIKSWKYREFCDNWAKNSVKASSLQAAADEAEGDWRRSDEDLTMSDVVNRLKIITDSTLKRTSEFEGNSLAPQADEEPFDWEKARKKPRERQLSSGEVIRYKVYNMKGVNPQESEGIVDEPASEVQPAEEQATLVGQAEGESDTVAAPSPQPATPPRRPSSVEYAPLKDTSGLFAMADGGSPLSAVPRVSDVSPNGGIKLHPDTDLILEGNTSGDPEKTPYVFGDPRLKVASITTSINGTYLSATCSFRIGVVTINGQQRSRVIMTVIDASGVEGSSDDAAKQYIGYSKPLDFEFMGVEPDHANLYDYEFDIAFTTVPATYGSIDMVHLVVVSGLRDQGDATSIVSASTDLVFSYVNFRASDAFGRTNYLVKSVDASVILASDFAEDERINNTYHCISNVRIGTDGTDESWHLLIGMLDRSSDSIDAVLSDNYGDGSGDTVKTSVIFAILDQRAQEWLVPSRADIEDAMDIQEIRNGTILGMNISPKISDAYTVMLTSTRETFFFVVKLDEEEAVFTSIKMAPMLESSMRLVPWPQQSCFLTTYPTQDYFDELNESGEWKNPEDWDRSRWVLQKCWWEEELDNPNDPNSGTPMLHFEPIGPENFNIDTFGINRSGSFIFWPSGREGNDGRIYHDDGTYEMLDENDTHLYQLMAARVYKGVFSDPFVVAEVDHHMSDVTIVATSNRLSPLGVLSVEHVQSGTDSEGDPEYLHHEANIWYTGVPHVVCATVVDCYAPTPFVSAGGTLAFHVTIRNDGNCFLKGCTLQLCLHGTTTNEAGEKVATTEAERVEGSVAKLWIGEDTLRESHFNPRNETTGELENVEVDFALAPGKRSVYEVRMPIPKDWSEGEKFVSLVASVNRDEDIAEGGVLAQAEDEGEEYQEFSVEPGVYRPYIQRSTPDEDKNRTHMDVINVDANEVPMDTAADAPLTHWTGDDAGQSSVPAPSGAQLPRTGDPFSGVAKAIAAAGTALAAYGAYRARNEGGARDQDE